MSSTSIDGRIVLPTTSRQCGRAPGQERYENRAARNEPGLLEILSLSGWRVLLLETVVLLALIAALRHWFFGLAPLPGMPHPYLIPVLLASCQYGVTGGMLATVAASAAYCLELSPQSGTQEFHSYIGTIAVQPTAWLATALILGGLRSLHIYRTAELAEDLAECRRCASDLADGLERAAVGIAALERRIASDTSSVAALSRSFSKLNLSDRATAATSFGELFRVGTGATTFTIYLKTFRGYVPVFAIDDDVICPATSVNSVDPGAVDVIQAGKMWCNGIGDRGSASHVILVPPNTYSEKPLAAIACQGLPDSQDISEFRLRAGEFAHAFATILSTCPEQQLGDCR